MRLLILLLFISCTHSTKNPSFGPQYIEIDARTLSSGTHSYAYDEVLIDAPNFSVDQYDPGLKDLFKKDGVSLLCQPASFATALIKDVKNNPKARVLKLEGLSVDRKSIDANKLVRQLVQCMKWNQGTGANSTNGANCITNIYKKSGLEYDADLISFFKKDGLHSSIKFEHRVPTARDIIIKLKNNYHVVGLIDFFKMNKNGNWEVTEGHVTLISGYARQKSWDKNLLYVFMADPSFNYKKSEYPRYHQFLLSKSSKTSGLPSWTSDLFLEGATMTGLYDRAFLSGLLAFKIR